MMKKLYKRRLTVE